MSENHSQSITIAVDAMGGDFGVKSAIPALRLVHDSYPEVRFLVFGNQDDMRSVLSKYGALESVCTLIHTDKAISSDEKPSAALRRSAGTSMRMAIEAVQSGEAQAVVSAGNTGALMALSKMILKTLPAIHRPALASVFPSLTGKTVMLDLGANVLVDAENLAQFAVLGSVFAKIYLGLDKPNVGLLNVGTEKNKGPEHVRAADTILSNVQMPGRYYGFVEGNDITLGTVDVVVSDGYAGNIALKAAEGVGKFTGELFKKTLKSDPLAILGGILAFFALKRFQKKVDPRLYNGGVFLGLNGMCVKSHGGSDSVAFSSAVRLAVELAEHSYVEKVSSEINDLMSQDMFLSEGV